MKVDIWIPIYIGDFLADTQELDAEETGVYFLLIMHAFKHKEIPKDKTKLLRITRLYDAEKFSIIQSIISSYFTETDTGYKNRRADEEREKAEIRSNAARSNAMKRWDKEIVGKSTNKKTPKKDAMAMQPQCNGNAEGYAKSMRNVCSSSSSSKSSKKKPPTDCNGISEGAEVIDFESIREGGITF